MRLMIRKSKTGDAEEHVAKYWDEDDYRSRYNALTDACWIYQYRDLEQNLRYFDWRQARRRILKQGALSREWVNRDRRDVRLTRRGLEMRFEGGIRVMDWKKLKEAIEARRW